MKQQKTVVIDASNLHSGGGVQVAASFINELHEQDPRWLKDSRILVSSRVRENLHALSQNMVELRDTRLGPGFLIPARTIDTDVRFTIFGPTYGPRIARRELLGLADPLLPQQYAPSEVTSNHTRIQKIKIHLKRAQTRNSDHFVVESMTYANSLGTLGIPKSRISVISNSPSSTFHGQPSKRASDLFPNSSEITLIYPARPYAHKNIDFLGQVGNELQTHGVNVTFIVTITAEELASYSLDTQKFCQPAGVVTQKQLLSLYEKSDAVFFPSLLEVSSATPLEAMILGIPLIASDRKFIRESAQDAAWYFDPRCPQDAARAIINASRDIHESQKRSARGRHLVDNYSSATQRAEKYIQLISENLDIAKTQKTIIVAHPAQQHSMKTAEAIDSLGYRLRYVTPVYDRPGSLTNLITLALPEPHKTRAQSRKNRNIAISDVIQVHEKAALLLLLLQRLPRARILYEAQFRLLTHLFNRSVAKLARKEQAIAVISYDTFSAQLFNALRRTTPDVRRILDMSAPAAGEVDKYLRASIVTSKDPETRSALNQQISGFAYRRSLKYTRREIADADHFLVASEFTRKTLELEGVTNANKIHICRYGISQPTDVDNLDTAPAGSLKIIFVGSLTTRKGIERFFEVADRMHDRPFVFTAIGAIHDRIKAPRNVRLTGHILKEQVMAEMETADVILFPSLADGFGLSVAEAMSRGVLPIVSTRAGVSDIIRDGKNGFIVRPDDCDSMVAILTMLEDQRQRLQKLKAEAKTAASSLTWANYTKDLHRAMKAITTNSSPQP